MTEEGLEHAETGVARCRCPRVLHRQILLTSPWILQEGQDGGSPKFAPARTHAPHLRPTLHMERGVGPRVGCCPRTKPGPPSSTAKSSFLCPLSHRQVMSGRRCKTPRTASFWDKGVWNPINWGCWTEKKKRKTTLASPPVAYALLQNPIYATALFSLMHPAPQPPPVRASVVRLGWVGRKETGIQYPVRPVSACVGGWGLGGS